MSTFKQDKPEMEHVKRLHRHATKILKIYTDEANPREVNALLKVIRTDIDYLSIHHGEDVQTTSVPTSERVRRLPGAWEPDQHAEPVVLSEPPAISCKEKVKRQFDLAENTYRAAFVHTSKIIVAHELVGYRPSCDRS